MYVIFVVESGGKYCIKTESIKKLSNQWTKTLYQNNLKYIALLFTIFKSYRRN